MTEVKTETAKSVARLCEVTDKASRELDAAVHKIVSGVNAYPNSVYAWEFIKDGKVHRLPLYTESVDAALKLIPSGHDIAELKSSPSGCAVRLWIPSNPACGYGRRCTGATKALAICSAALRAIET